MRAVNLIPAEERRNAGGVAGRSNGAVYLLLAALALAVVVLAAHSALSARAERADADAAALNAEATSTEARVAARRASVPSASYGTLREKRVDAVQALIASRVDWPSRLRELGQVLPTDVTLQALTASTAAGASASDGGGSLRSALDVPAIELTGCAASQAEVARTLADLQALSGVTRVSLQSSEAADAASSGAAAPDTSGGGSATSESCGTRPVFSAVVFLSPARPLSPTSTSTP